MGATAFVSLAIGAAALAGRPQSSAERAPGEPQRRALLVAVQDYGRETGWPVLRGPLLDLTDLRQVLIERAGFAADDVHVLCDLQATRAAIGASFNALIEATRPDDLLLFYFAGHGSRLPDDDGDELDGWDETLVPFDVRDDQGRPNDVRDDELCAWVNAASLRTDRVVLVFDCCSSGTNSRGDPSAGVRFVDPRARGFAGARLSSRPTEDGSGYLQPSRSYVSLAACRSDESAYELVLEPDEADAQPTVRGLFTWCLARELETAGDGLSWSELGERVRTAVQTREPRQTPVVEGPLAAASLFGGRRTAPVQSFELETSSKGSWLAAGRLHGLGPAAELEVRERSDGEERVVGRVRVPEPGVVHSVVEWIDGQAPLTRSSQRAHLVDRGRQAGRLAVALDARLAEGARAQALVRRIGMCGGLEQVEPGSTATLWLASRRAAGVLSVHACAANGRELPLAARLDSEEELDRLVGSLERISRARVLLDAFKGLSASHASQAGLRADWVELDSAGSPAGAREGVDGVDNGAQVGLSLVHAASEPLHVSLLGLRPDAAIELLWSSADEGEPLIAGRELKLSFELTIDRGSEAFFAAAPYHFVWLATREPHGHLGALVQPPATIGSRAGSSAEKLAESLFESADGGPQAAIASIWIREPACPGASR